MKNRVLLASGILLASLSALLANGGGYFRGGVENTGDVAGFEPKATENIRILDEKLTVKIGPKEADVEVRYLMKNVTDKKVKVRFGFPVEESIDSDLMAEKPATPDPKKLSYCKNYQISASGDSVKSIWKGEVFDGKDKRFRGIAGWLVSELSFGPNEEKPVQITFQSAYPFEEWEVSESVTRSAAVFRYRLSTAACWNASIQSGRIVLQPTGIDPASVKIIKPVNRFRMENGNWVWNFENLEPTLADDFEVEAKPREASHPARSEMKEQSYAQYIERGTKWTMAHSNYRVKASSTLAADGDIRYEPENLRLFWGEMWSEGAKGPGVGEWLELAPDVPKPLTAISMKPGCFKNKALFKANARPKKAKIELNGEKSFTVSIPDMMEEIEIPIPDYKMPVKKIRITFEEVWPGTKFEDLCVTSIRLHVRLDKKPKLDPCR